jgi:hypothetical protein
VKQYEETIEYFRQGLEIDADFYITGLVMGLTQPFAGFAQEAVASLKRVAEVAPWWPRRQECARRPVDSYGHTYGAAGYYAVTGEVDAMFGALDGSLFDPYYSGPRFQALLQRTNLIQ